ncbi:hypothetical protein ACUXNS_000543 [Brevibacterium pityocampae]
MSDADQNGAERPRRFYAPLIAGAIVLLSVIALVIANAVRQPEALTVDALQSPAVGALGAGEDIYPANSAEAIEENAKFGYLPAVATALLSDGTVALANPEAGPEDLGLEKPLEQTDAATFAAARIAPAPLSEDSEGEAEDAETTRDGTPITWEQALMEYGDATVFMPEVASGEVLGPVLEAIEAGGRPEGVIIRSSDLEVLRIAVDRDITALYSGDATAVTPDALLDAGVGMAAVPADSDELDTWLGSEVEVWATGAESAGAFADLAERGVFGALSANPFAIQPSNVKTD